MICNSQWTVRYTKPDYSLPLLDRILTCRGITREELALTIKDMYDPFLMNDMGKAIDIIIDAIENKKKILIHGDYDVDGTTATETLLKFFREVLNYPVEYYIPDRLKNGYGLTQYSVDYIIMGEYDLVITVDCGITSIEQINMLKALGTKVIVTDHHECKEVLPDADAVIDCKRPDNTYPCSFLAGCGVALKICQALCEKLELGNAWENYLVYTALGTVADVVPLRDENRIIVKEGIERIKKSTNPGIKNLLRISDKLENINEFNSEDISFYLAPRINASSRVGSVNVIMELFETNSEERAYELANELEKLNEKRKQIEQQILEESNKKLIKYYEFKSMHPVIVYGDDWHRGVIGIAASRLKDRYHRPTIVLSRDKNSDVYHGSCRSCGNIDIMNMLKYAESKIIQYGGHEKAAGLAVAEIDIEDFIELCNEYSSMHYTESDFLEPEEAEMIINPEDITVENIKSLDILQPFGEGNPKLKFICTNLKTVVIKQIGKKTGFENAHLKMTLCDVDDALKTYEAIGFFMGEYYNILPSKRKIDMLFTLGINEYNGKISPQIMIEDIHFPIYYKEGTTAEDSEMFELENVPIEDIIEFSGVKKEDIIPNQAEYNAIYKFIINTLQKPKNETIVTDLNILTSLISTALCQEYNPFKVDMALEAINEAGFLDYRKLLFGQIMITTPYEGKAKCKIVETPSYKKLNSGGR